MLSKLIIDYMKFYFSQEMLAFMIRDEYAYSLLDPEEKETKRLRKKYQSGFIENYFRYPIKLGNLFLDEEDS